ncbi:hypothetical protein Cgig2_006006 [Carnegiea gigantea]|uniref:Ig-like domain-containing protein n=1 Tax=Carnegiea gigantea TaxID=171969 RepID=A0A9Q1KWL1_9CARY|nr:hypothetical protein Cgig2_006006 [Carnegiea gigantea]
MVLLFFVLDLRSLSPPLLEAVTECLLELANLYAVSAPKVRRCTSDSEIGDRIGLCYLQRSAISSSNELKVAYSPRGRSFSLRDFHYAVKHLPSDSHSPPLLDDFGSARFHDVDFSSMLSDEVLDSTGAKDVERKIVLISSYLIWNMDSEARKTLLDAADRCVSMEFVFLEQKSSQLNDLSESVNKFRQQICDLENCSFNAILPDACVFNGLVKRWLWELGDNTDEMLEALFVFQNSIAGSINQVSCKLCNSINQIMDGLSPCMVRCFLAEQHRSSASRECFTYDFTKPHRGMILRIWIHESGKHTLTLKNPWRSWGNIRKCGGGNTLILSFHPVCQEWMLLQKSDRGYYACHVCNIETVKKLHFTTIMFFQPLIMLLAGAEEILLFPDVNLSVSSADRKNLITPFTVGAETTIQCSIVQASNDKSINFSRELTSWAGDLRRTATSRWESDSTGS